VSPVPVRAENNWLCPPSPEALKMVHVQLLIRPEIDWKNFLKTTREVLGRSVASQLDTENANSWDAASFLSALSEIWHPGLSTKDAQREAGNLLQHLFLSVLAISGKDLALEISQETGLAAKSQCSLREEFYLTIVTGDLSQWRTAIINNSTDEVSQGMREFMSKCHDIFEKAGLQELWAFYKKKHLPDHTQVLLPK
jgi:hypothetical protein